MLVPVFALNQTGSSNTLLLNDITGSYSSGNLTGWGAPNLDVSQVASISISGTYRPAPSFAAPVNIPSFELMPTTANPLPYVLGQQFVISPSTFGFTTPTFSDGIYQIQVNINTNLATITSTANLHGGYVFTAGQAVGFYNGAFPTDNLIGTGVFVQYVTDYIVEVYLTSGIIQTGMNTGIGGITGGSQYTYVSSVTYVETTYTANPQLYLTVNADCCIGNAMRKYCNCSCPENVELNTAWMQLLSSKEMAGCFQYNSCLDTLYLVQKYCNNCGCN